MPRFDPPPWLGYVLFFGGIAFASYFCFSHTETGNETINPVRWSEIGFGFVFALSGLAFLMLGKRRIWGVLVAILTITAFTTWMLWAINIVAPSVDVGERWFMSIFVSVGWCVLVAYNIRRLRNEDLMVSDPIAEARDLLTYNQIEAARDKLERAVFEFPDRANEIQTLLNELHQRQSKEKRK